MNASGRLGYWTVDGEEVWVRTWPPTLDRPFNKQYEPIKFGDTILNVEPLAPDDPKRREDGKRGAPAGELNVKLVRRGVRQRHRVRDFLAVLVFSPNRFEDMPREDSAELVD